MEIEKKRTLQDAIESLREDLEDPNIGYHLWDILCGLRGPDGFALGSEESEKIKRATTQVIRRKFCAETRGYAATGADSEKALLVRRNMIGPQYSHFRAHARWAFDRLGLTWDEVNKD